MVIRSISFIFYVLVVSVCGLALAARRRARLRLRPCRCRCVPGASSPRFAPPDRLALPAPGNTRAVLLLVLVLVVPPVIAPGRVPRKRRRRQRCRRKGSRPQPYRAREIQILNFRASSPRHGRRRRGSFRGKRQRRRWRGFVRRDRRRLGRQWQRERRRRFEFVAGPCVRLFAFGRQPLPERTAGLSGLARRARSLGRHGRSLRPAHKPTCTFSVLCCALRSLVRSFILSTSMFFRLRSCRV
jgi:hypothetical protein